MALATLSRKTKPSRSNAEMEPQDLAKLIDQILRIDFLCFEPICWKRAAVLHRYLRLNGLETHVVFGMRREIDGQMHGHAWLEAGGKPILEKEEPAYTVTYSFPSAANFEIELSTLEG